VVGVGRVLGGGGELGVDVVSDGLGEPAGISRRVSGWAAEIEHNSRGQADGCSKGGAVSAEEGGCGLGRV
jgi:hypothetical protein